MASNQLAYLDSMVSSQNESILCELLCCYTASAFAVVEVCASFENESVWVKQLARRPSHVDGRELKKGESTIMKTNSTLSISDHLHYSLLFVHTPAASAASNGKKASTSNDGMPPSKRRKTNKDDALPFRVTNVVEEKQKLDVTSSTEAEVAASNSEDEIERKLASMKETLNSHATKTTDSKQTSEKSQTTSKSEEASKAHNTLSSFINREMTSCNTSVTSERWQVVRNRAGYVLLMVYTGEASKPSARVAAFDIDNTISRTKSGKKFPQNADDWQ